MPQMCVLSEIVQMIENSAPDYRFKKRVLAEKEAIREALLTVGEYVIQVDDLIYVISTKKKQERKPTGRKNR